MGACRACRNSFCVCSCFAIVPVHLSKTAVRKNSKGWAADLALVFFIIIFFRPCSCFRVLSLADVGEIGTPRIGWLHAEHPTLAVPIYSLFKLHLVHLVIANLCYFRKKRFLQFLDSGIWYFPNFWNIRNFQDYQLFCMGWFMVDLAGVCWPGSSRRQLI